MTTYKSLQSPKTQAGIDATRENLLATFGTRGLDALTFVRCRNLIATEWQTLTDQEIRQAVQDPFWIEAVIS